jgi:hypothetical protein
MLAIPAPATLETNCRRDIVMDLPETLLTISSAVVIVSDLSDGSYK